MTKEAVIHSLLLILVIALVTLLTRALPFMLFPKGKKTPKVISYLGRVMPAAVIGMLVVYCFKDTAVISWPYALPELIAAAVVVLLHLWKRNTLLSCGVGTVCYMLLVQFVFK